MNDTEELLCKHDIQRYAMDLGIVLHEVQFFSLFAKCRENPENKLFVPQTYGDPYESVMEFMHWGYKSGNIDLIRYTYYHIEDGYHFVIGNSGPLIFEPFWNFENALQYKCGQCDGRSGIVDRIQ